MSGYGYAHDEWLGLKHHVKPSCVYRLGCGIRENDWDFADVPSRGYATGYALASEDSPIHLLNNSGGMDEDDVVPKDVWHPYQSAPVAEQTENDMSDASSSDDMDMDMDADMESQQAPQLEQQQIQQHQQQQQQQQQQIPQQMQQFPQPFAQQIVNAAPVNKRKRGAMDSTPSVVAYEYQQMNFDSSKRVRVGA